MKFILLTLISIAVITFALSNRQEVLLGIFPFEFKIALPAFLLMFIFFILGVVIGGMSSILHNLRLRRLSKTTKKQLTKLEKEINTLRESSDKVSTI